MAGSSVSLLASSSPIRCPPLLDIILDDIKRGTAQLTTQ
jgi:hypothetical protein